MYILLYPFSIHRFVNDDEFEKSNFISFFCLFWFSLKVYEKRMILISLTSSEQSFLVLYAII